MVLLILFGSLIIVPIFGKSRVNTTLDIETLKLAVLKDNVSLKKYDESIRVAEFKLKKAEDEEDEGGSSTLEYLKKSDYYPKEAEMLLDYAKWSRIKKEQELKLDSEKYYYTYLLLEDEINLQEEKIKRIENNLEDTKKRVTLGLDKRSILMQLENKIDNETFVLNELINEKDKAGMEINVLMNKPMNTEFELKSSDIPFKVYKVDDINTKISETLEDHGELNKMIIEKSLIYIESKLYRELDSGDDEKKITDLNEDGVEKECDIEDKKVSIEYDIRSSYNKLLNAYDSITIQEVAIKDLKIDEDAARKRLEVGLVTKSSVDELEETIAFKELELKQAKLDYYIAVQSFKNLFINE